MIFILNVTTVTMPKKNSHKGKPKTATQESEDFVLRKNENFEEEYVTVADFESNKKYSKRLLRNNWSKYESAITDLENSEETNELPKTDDFNDLVQTASSDCSFFQFSSEKQWSNENTLPASAIFNLDVSILSSGLACLPFYERIGLSESHLSAEEKERFDREAAESLKEYNLFWEKNKKDENNDNTKSLDEPVKVNVDLCEEKVNDDTEVLDEVQRTSCSEGDKVLESKKILFFDEKDENLEDWLDSVLDD